MSCQNEKKGEPKNKEAVKRAQTIETGQKSLQISKNINEKTKASQKIKKDSLDNVLIGKTTQELQKYKFYTCLEVVLESQKYAVTIYSLNVDNCHNGKNKVVIGKFINYYEQGKANFEIKDELIVTSNFPKKCHSNIRIKLIENQLEKNYIIEYEDNSKETLTKIYRLWEIDLNNEKFIQVEIPENFKCDNLGYADGI
ncbi:hypothetical protein D1001_10165 [Riemerella anatipestifer]|nr:hypothetical protein AWB57_11040 [Riemerella anatipestifer]MRN03628.1 hypothetical protein [Riemerella anatipestifer]